MTPSDDCVNISPNVLEQIKMLVKYHPKGTICHWSASPFGDVEEITKWHKKRRFDTIGYNFVILNGHSKPGSRYNPEDDGKIEIGRTYLPGAHTLGRDSSGLGLNHRIGICYISNSSITVKQAESLTALNKAIMKIHRMDLVDITGHRENRVNNPKIATTCPGFDASLIRDWCRK